MDILIKKTIECEPKSAQEQVKSAPQLAGRWQKERKKGHLEKKE